MPPLIACAIFLLAARHSKQACSALARCVGSLGDCAGASPSQTPGRPPLHWPPPQGSRTLKGKRLQDSPRPRAAAACRCPFYRAPEAVERLAMRSPSQPPRGEENNARPAPFEPPSVQENPCHNIIPSVLWNSRQHPHFHAVTASIREGQKPASAPSPASDSTIRIMLRNSVSPSNHPHPSGRSARRQERSFAPGPSPALARRKTPHFRGPPPQKCTRPVQPQREENRHHSHHCSFLPPRAAQLRVAQPTKVVCQ